jgi:hypothetical protein
MKITTNYNSKKGPSANETTKALVLEGPQHQVYELRETLSTWYGSKSTSFPDAVCMRLIPPLDALSDANTCKTGFICFKNGQRFFMGIHH